VDFIVPKDVNFLKVLQENPRSSWPWVKGMRQARNETQIYTGLQLQLVIIGLFERLSSRDGREDPAGSDQLTWGYRFACYTKLNSAYNLACSSFFS